MFCCFEHYVIFNNGNGTTATEQTVDLSASSNICWEYSGTSSKYGVTVNSSCTTAVETPTEDNWSLYPNPTRTTVMFNLPENTKIVTVTSALGTQLNLQIPSTQLNAELDLSSYPSGIYYITLCTKDGVRQTKSVVKM